MVDIHNQSLLEQDREDLNIGCQNCCSVISSGAVTQECPNCKKRLCISCKELQTKIGFMINGPMGQLKDCHLCKVLADLKKCSRPPKYCSVNNKDSTLDLPDVNTHEFDSKGTGKTQTLSNVTHRNLDEVSSFTNIFERKSSENFQNDALPEKLVPCSTEDKKGRRLSENVCIGGNGSTESLPDAGDEEWDKKIDNFPDASSKDLDKKIENLPDASGKDSDKNIENLPDASGKDLDKKNEKRIVHSERTAGQSQRNKSFYSKYDKKESMISYVFQPGTTNAEEFVNCFTESDKENKQPDEKLREPLEISNVSDLGHKDEKLAINVMRQESCKSQRGRKKKMSKHICAGCGRRDCEGQFMKLLREMIQTAKKNKFEIRNVVPDGNCMFAAIVDQLELAGCQGMFSAIYLRQEAVNYLRAHPESEDGTHYLMFMDGEDWEEYLTRMARDGQWGDHLMLKAIAKVTMRDIRVLSGSENRGFTDIKSGADQPSSEPLVLGHVGELHYVSLRPASSEELSMEKDDEIEEEDLVMSSTPQYIDVEKRHMFLGDYVDPYSETPALHFGFLIKKFLPLSHVLSVADRSVSTALSFEYMDESTTDEGKTSSKPTYFTLKTIGDIANGLCAGAIENKNSESGGITPWTDVVVLQVVTNITTLQPGIELKSTDEVSMETHLVHPGYTRLRCVYPTSKDGKKDKLEMFYYPNSYDKFQARQLSDEEKQQRVSQYGSHILSMFSEYKGAFPCLFWPDEANEWADRVRPTNWPSETLIQAIISNGCHLVAEPHIKSNNPGIEFRISFGAAEKSLCEEGLSRDQRFCYIAFKAFCYQELKDVSLINSDHLRSIFFYACEHIQAEFWSSKLGGCIFYLFDCLISGVSAGCIPCYFIRTNNLISHLTTEEKQTVIEKLDNLRSQPLQHFMSFKMALNDTEAMHVLENVRDDMERNFLLNFSERKSVLECFVPMSIDMAKRNIEKKNFKKALDEVQAAYEERLTVATCEDNLPFVDFLNEVVSTVEFNLQWWFLLFADEKLGTTLSCDISMSNEPVALEDLVGDEAAKDYKSTLIPSRLASCLCTFLYDFAFYLYMKYRTTQAVSCLQLCIERHNQLLYYSQQGSFSANDDKHADMMGDFTDKNMLKIFIFLYLCCTRLRKYDVIAQYLPAMEGLCARRGTREPYYQLSLLYKSLGYEEDSTRALSQYHQLPAGDGDVIQYVSQDVMSQTTSF